MATPRPTAINDLYIEQVCERFRKNLSINRRLPVWGRMHIDRQLPFLFVYRRPAGAPDAGTHRLLVGEAAYLLSSGERRLRKSVTELVRRTASTAAEVFGSSLVIEIWASPQEEEPPHSEAVQPPRFRIHHSGSPELASTLETLETALSKIRVRKRLAMVQSEPGKKLSPAGLPALIAARRGATASSVHLIGLEVRPVYRHDASTVFPLVLRELHRKLARALKKVVFRFTRDLTTHRPRHYHSLGRRAISKAVWEVDRTLAEIGNQFDFLLASTPVNSRKAWTAFERNHFEKPPRFLYRPLMTTPASLKRKLFIAPIERIEDPELSWIFYEKQYELDRQLTALIDRETPRFMYGSLQIFGGVDNELFQTASELLDKIPPRARETGNSHRVNAREFAARAKAEIDYFRAIHPETRAKVEIRVDISGLMVSKGNLLIPADLEVPASRVEALIQHEVGTHVLTYENGLAQPFRQLYSGLAGYDPLQEGLAVLAEFLVGGLSPPRLRLLAARVFAVRRMLEGATFIDTFRELVGQVGLSRPAAYTVAMRVHRGGGLTKDAAYLRGLIQLLEYLKEGGDIEPLLVGKIGSDHVPVVLELMRRKVLKPPPLRPRYLESPEAAARLRHIRDNGTVFDLIRLGRQT